MLKGILWRGGYQVFHQLASLLVKIILIRILLPQDFGILAMAMIVFTSLDIINRFAGGEPFIRDHESDNERAKNTLFYLNLIFLGTTSILCFFSAPLIAQFFSSKISDPKLVPTLVWIVRVFSIRLLFSLAADIPMAVLTKKLRFKPLYQANLVGTFAYLITAPVLAYLGLGIWSIVLAYILESLVITALFFYFEPFIPTLTFDPKIAKSYLTYNTNLFVNAVVLIIITNGDDTIIGRLMGPVVLGFYNIGQQFALLSLSLIQNNVNVIIFPVLAKIQGDPQAFQRVFFKAYRIVNLLALPFIGGLVVLAKDIVLVFFGEEWLPLVPVLYILSLAAVLNCFISITNPVLKSMNKPHIIRNCQLMELAGFAVLIFPFARTWGHLGVCWVLVLLSLIPVLYLLPQTAREIRGLYSRIIRIQGKIIICTLVMMTAVVNIKTIFPSSGFYLMFSVLAGVIIYFLPMFFWDKELKSDVMEGWNILRQRR